MAVGFVRVWRAVEPNHPKAYLYREMMVSGHVGSPFADPRGAMKARIARGLKLGLSEQHAEQLARLRQPEDVQDFVNALPMNFENDGWTALSVQGVLSRQRAHCIEGAVVAACALMMARRPPLLMDMGAAEGDDDHVIALFRRGRTWGAISKSNGPYLRWRDPIYRSLYALAMSYFPEYAKGRQKMLRTYSASVDLRRLDPSLWVTREKSCVELIDILTRARHYRLVPRGHENRLREIDPVEAEAQAMNEYRNPHANASEARRAS